MVWCGKLSCQLWWGVGIGGRGFDLGQAYGTRERGAVVGGLLQLVPRLNYAQNHCLFACPAKARPLFLSRTVSDKKRSDFTLETRPFVSPSMPGKVRGEWSVRQYSALHSKQAVLGTAGEASRIPQMM
jgi:hypothetical protein